MSVEAPKSFSSIYVNPVILLGETSVDVIIPYIDLPFRPIQALKNNITNHIPLFFSNRAAREAKGTEYLSARRKKAGDLIAHEQKT